MLIIIFKSDHIAIIIIILLLYCFDNHVLVFHDLVGFISWTLTIEKKICNFMTWPEQNMVMRN